MAGVVLAGGSSRRMGRDKATLLHPGSGRPLVEHTVAVLAQRCDPVFVVAAPGQPLPALPGAVVLRDEVRGLGPLLATGRGLRAAAEAGAMRAFVAAVDMPNLTTAVIDRLTARDADVVLPWDGRDHYLAGIYRTSLAPRVEALVADGARSMRALTDSVCTWRMVLEGTGDGTGELANVNTVADLGAAAAREA